jgi:sugar lactone lactonase YvrE
MVKSRERTSSFSICASRLASLVTCVSSACGRERAAQGPAWFAAGRYLIWSDIPDNRMLRFVEPSGEVSVFRERSNNSNGNTIETTKAGWSHASISRAA